MPTRHTHLQLNIQQTMSAAHIVADVQRAFSLNPDTIVFNEAVARTHIAILSHAAKYGYEVFIPEGAASQVVLVWKKDVFYMEYASATFAMAGRKGVTPSRYVVRARLLHYATGRHMFLVGTHMVASGWTGGTDLDAWRQAGWYAHEKVMAGILSRLTAQWDIVLWSGDMNRPPSTFPNGVVFPAFQVEGAKTSMVLQTDHTHGPVTFDYVGVLSQRIAVKVIETSTPAFNSDHDGVLAVLEW